MSFLSKYSNSEMEQYSFGKTLYKYEIASTNYQEDSQYQIQVVIRILADNSVGF